MLDLESTSDPGYSHGGVGEGGVVRDDLIVAWMMPIFEQTIEELWPPRSR